MIPRRTSAERPKKLSSATASVSCPSPRLRITTFGCSQHLAVEQEHKSKVSGEICVHQIFRALSSTLLNLRELGEVRRPALVSYYVLFGITMLGGVLLRGGLGADLSQFAYQSPFLSLKKKNKMNKSRGAWAHNREVF